ncbi:MAG: enoyl-CoA hydratase-related protein [Bacteroidia bacterium]|nr:enoyl-CoA hydratase-related protein [Bacteroidia bacterium]
MSFEFIEVTPAVQSYTGLIRLNRPRELNALNTQLMEELVTALAAFDEDENCRVVVLTGNEKAFAAGADIKEMAGKTAIDMLQGGQMNRWERIKQFRKPLIAAVSGFALGGGCELCMLCDMIIASETAQFGQPEIKIGVIPGAGGTQRMARAMGKYRAMEMVLTGKFISAAQAYEWGLVNRVVPPEVYLDEALRLAAEIASMPPLAAQLAKASVLHAANSFLDEGLTAERKNFYLLFASEDQREGMNAFVEKRKPDWKGR